MNIWNDVFWGCFGGVAEIARSLTPFFCSLVGKDGRAQGLRQYVWDAFIHGSRVRKRAGIFPCSKEEAKRETFRLLPMEDEPSLRGTSVRD